MEYGICLLSVVPVRASQNDKSEMVTQLLFGDLISILEKNKKWAKIITEYDNYEGYIDVKQYVEIPEEEYFSFQKQSDNISIDKLAFIKNTNDESIINIVQGTSLPSLSVNKVNIAKQEYEFIGNIKHIDINEFEKICETALLYVNVPYLWGGRTILGIDCSGLSQIVYKICGIKLPRDARQQALIGTTVEFLSESLDGDLAFFDNDKGDIIHVGIIMNKNQIIHASGCVRVDTIDHEGIYNASTQKYTHKLRLIKTFRF